MVSLQEYALAGGTPSSGSYAIAEKLIWSPTANRCVGAGVGETRDRAADEIVRVEVAARADLQVGRAPDVCGEILDLGGIGQTVCAGQHHKDATPGVVGREHRTVVARGVRPAAVEGDA